MSMLLGGQRKISKLVFVLKRCLSDSQQALPQGRADGAETDVWLVVRGVEWLTDCFCASWHGGRCAEHAGLLVSMHK
eukprot:1798839-Amphidinium_carterae.1